MKLKCRHLEVEVQATPKIKENHRARKRKAVTVVPQAAQADRASQAEVETKEAILEITIKTVVGFLREEIVRNLLKVQNFLLPTLTPRYHC